MKKPRMCDQNDVQLDVKYELETPVNYAVLKYVLHIDVLFSLLLSVLESFNVQLLLRTVLTVGRSY